MSSTRTVCSISFMPQCVTAKSIKLRKCKNYVQGVERGLEALFCRSVATVNKSSTLAESSTTHNMIVSRIGLVDKVVSVGSN